MNKDFNFKSVLNTDSFDRRKYTELRNISSNLQDLEASGHTQLPTFPHLLGDVWSALFKNMPELKKDGADKEVLHHRPLMEKLMSHPDFQGLRQHSKLDPFMSGLCTISFGDEIQKIIQDMDQEQKNELQKQLKKAQKQFEKAEQARKERELEQDLSETSQDEAEKKDWADKAKKSARREKNAEKNGQSAVEQAQAILADIFNSPSGEKKLEKAIKAAGESAKDTAKQVEGLIPSMGAGTKPGEPEAVSPLERLKLAEKLKGNDKLKKIANLTGKAKIISSRKQKTKTKFSTQRSSVEYGDAIERIVPQELLSMKHARLQFLKRFSESSLLQYSKEGKEALGYGPILICLDTSGSIGERQDIESKSIALALLEIAVRQKRPFGVINFSSLDQIKSWYFHDPKKVKANDIIEIAETYLNGGTCFQTPLNEVKRLILADKVFKPSDVIFITDGEADIDEEWLKDFNTFKGKAKVNITSIYLERYKNNDAEKVLASFSNKVISSESLFSDEVSGEILAI